MRDFLEGVKKFKEFLLEIGAAQSTLLLPSPRMLMLGGPEDSADPQRLFSVLVTESEIVDVARDLFASGHFSLAIQQACIALEKYLQAKTGNMASGTILMDQVFGPHSPKLFWSNRATQSQKDEQLGYHRLYAGTMFGIRNPCTHEFNWVQDSATALELLMLVQHLLRKGKISIPQAGSNPP